MNEKHLAYKASSVHLSRELRAKYGFRSLPVRTGDRVLIIRGDYKGMEGDVSKVDRNRGRVYISGVYRENARGEQRLVPIPLNSVILVKIDEKDKWRHLILERKRKTVKEGSEGGA
ncbi:MAG: 50S ribosomal protein L24 [Crenarchaeota archaeon]|nr:50S ribosomal protein L24 [Thermoproteota archaeon]MDW8033825.1 50S ribosomal protein L24 [Nitrososphaerota archaeon]